MANLKQFENQQYLNIETFRKSGVGVKTPVWFAQDGDILYIWTDPESGKAKRIRNNPGVKIVPCKAEGTPVGDWVPAKATIDDSPEGIEHTQNLFKKKYGMMFRMFNFSGKIRGAKLTSIRVQLEA